jgi:hypothetical protein
MEVFPLDIQRMLLRFVSNNYIENLRHLYCVNQMFRRWVSRYVIDTCDKGWFLERVLLDMYVRENKTNFIDWNVFETLSQKWSIQSSTLLSSYVMYLSAKERVFSPYSRFEIIDDYSVKLFYRIPSILTDIGKKGRLIERLCYTQAEIRKYSEEVKESGIYNPLLTDRLERRDSVNEVIRELDKKWSHKRIKTE